MIVQLCEYLFWIAVVLVIYPYGIFPFVVLVRRMIIHRPYKMEDIIEPKVSMIIAAYNEADDIEEKVKSVLLLNYPRELLEIIVASDGSTDGTDDIVRPYEAQGVRLLSLPRRGKAAAMNAAVDCSTGEVLVFSDANSILQRDAIRHLVRPLADATVGGVAGNQVYYPTRKNASLAATGERVHWWLDRKLKIAGSQSGNAISATGALYAIRRSLFMTVPTGVTDDFVTSTRVVAQGKRLVFEPEAIAYEPVAKSANAEFMRKVRVLTRGFCSVLLMRELLNVFQYGFYSVQLFSQKVMRRLVVLPLIVLLLVNPLLWFEGPIYQVAMLLQIAVYGSALLGFLLSTTFRVRLGLLTVPCYFCLINLASFLAAWNVVRGKRITRWDTQRNVVGRTSQQVA